MVRSPKTGRELGGEHFDKSPPWLRKMFDRLGISASLQAEKRKRERDG